MPAKRDTLVMTWLWTLPFLFTEYFAQCLRSEFSNFWKSPFWCIWGSKSSTSSENFLMKYIRKSLVFGPRRHMENKKEVFLDKNSLSNMHVKILEWKFSRYSPLCEEPMNYLMNECSTMLISYYLLPNINKQLRDNCLLTLINVVAVGLYWFSIFCRICFLLY